MFDWWRPLSALHSGTVLAPRQSTRGQNRLHHLQPAQHDDNGVAAAAAALHPQPHEAVANESPFPPNRRKLFISLTSAPSQRHSENEQGARGCCLRRLGIHHKAALVPLRPCKVLVTQKTIRLQQRQPLHH